MSPSEFKLGEKLDAENEPIVVDDNADVDSEEGDKPEGGSGRRSKSSSKAGFSLANLSEVLSDPKHVNLLSLISQELLRNQVFSFQSLIYKKNFRN